MGKHKIAVTIILSLALAALVAVAGVFGYALARSSFSDTDTGDVGEARWRVVAGEAVTAEGKASGMRPYEGTYAEYNEENSGENARVMHSFFIVGTVKNVGDVKASVTAEPGDMEPVVTGDAYDINEYTDEEIMEHISCEIYWSYSGDLESAGDYGVGDFSSASATLEPDPGETGVEMSVMYVYADVTWTSDLWIDVSEDGYDGTAGDMFDSWASRHLECLAFTMTITAAQAE